MNHRVDRPSRLVLAALGVALAGCATIPPFPATLHPSARPDQDAAGIAMGGSYVVAPEDSRDETDLGSSNFMIPYGEGYARFGRKKGQTELRVTPGLSFVSYRADLTRPDAGMGVSVVPSFGIGWVSMRTDSGSSSEITLAPSLSAIVLLADRTLYLSPRVGYAWANAIYQEEDHVHSTRMVGGTVGYLITPDDVHTRDRFHTSLELSVTRLVGDEEDGGDAIWAFVPSVGITR